MEKNQLFTNPLLAESRPPCYTWLVCLLTFTISLSTGLLYLRSAWHRYRLELQNSVVELAQVGKALLPLDDLDKLLGNNTQQIQKLQVEISQALTRLVATAEPIQDAFVIAPQEQRLELLASVDPELADMCDLPQDSLLGLTQPLVSCCQCGELLRIFVPLTSSAGQETVAALGISYASSAWQRDLKGKLLPQILLVACFILLIQASLFLLFKQNALKRKNRQLAATQNFYMSMFEHAPVGIALMRKGPTAESTVYADINPEAARIMGRDLEQLQTTNWLELTHPDDVGKNLDLFQSFSSWQIRDFVMEKRIMYPDGSYVWVNIKVARLLLEMGQDQYYLTLLEDISARKKAEQALQESERSKAIFLANLDGMAYRCKNDATWTMEFVSDGCFELTGYEPASLVGNRDIPFSELIAGEYRELVWQKWQQNLAQQGKIQMEYELVSKAGQRKWVMEFGQGIYDRAGQPVAIEGVIYDVTATKLREEEVLFLQKHDFLTGLYNRHQLEKEQKRLDKSKYLPLSLLICDINNLGATNDKRGFASGDLLLSGAASLLREVARPQDVLARTSGSEFILLMPNSDNSVAHQMRQKIQYAIKRYNRRPGTELSMTVAYATRTRPEQTIAETISHAYEYLKHRKILNKDSSQNAVLTSIMAALYAKSQETEEHGERLARLTSQLGEKLQLPAKKIDDLQLLAMLHDIGKIAVDDHILNKPGRLTETEWAEIKKHPEAGYQIAMSTLQLEHVAGYILHHHERWDGLGYPAGLKGEQIPLLARMLALADAYDVMTVGRIYNRKMTWQEALAELDDCAGSQFDPKLARIFIEMIKEEKQGQD